MQQWADSAISATGHKVLITMRKSHTIRWHTFNQLICSTRHSKYCSTI